MDPLKVLADSSERVKYNSAGLAIYSRHDELKRYAYSATGHWHPDLEFIYVVAGAMQFFVRGAVVDISPGMAILINSKRFHFGFSERRQECEFVATVIHPSVVLGDSPDAWSYLNKRTGHESEDFLLLDPGTSWQRQVIAQLIALNRSVEFKEATPIAIIALASRLVSTTLDHLSPYEPTTAAEGLGWASFASMVAFIQQNYPEPISVSDIARSGAVGRTTCYRVFEDYAGKPPYEYLQDVRLSASISLLKNSLIAVSEVASMCGYGSVSHYIHVFHERMGITPRSFRARAYS
ncbi:MAG: AraC family transcriptional regulator [Scrofimicrobium sp.]